MDNMRYFYMVSFEATGNFYFFKNKENADEYILNAYCELNPEITPEEYEEIYNEYNTNNGIEGFGWTDGVWFED